MLAQSFSIVCVTVCRGMSLSVPSITDSLIDPDCIFEYIWYFAERSACPCCAKPLSNLLFVFLEAAAHVAGVGQLSLSWHEDREPQLVAAMISFRSEDLRQNCNCFWMECTLYQYIACTETNVKVWTCLNVFDIIWHRIVEWFWMTE